MYSNNQVISMFLQPQAHSSGPSEIKYPYCNYLFLNPLFSMNPFYLQIQLPLSYHQKFSPHNCIQNIPGTFVLPSMKTGLTHTVYSKIPRNKMQGRVKLRMILQDNTLKLRKINNTLPRYPYTIMSFIYLLKTWSQLRSQLNNHPLLY